MMVYIVYCSVWLPKSGSFLVKDFRSFNPPPPPTPPLQNRPKLHIAMYSNGKGQKLIMDVRPIDLSACMHIGACVDISVALVYFHKGR